MVVVYFIVKSESKRSPGTDFAEEDMKENIRAIFAYIDGNFRIKSNSDNTFEYSKFRIRIEHSSHPYCPVDKILNFYHWLQLLLCETPRTLRRPSHSCRCRAC